MAKVAASKLGNMVDSVMSRKAKREGNMSKVKKQNEVVAKRAAEIIKEEKAVEAAKGPTRSDLLKEAKAAGILWRNAMDVAELKKALELSLSSVAGASDELDKLCTKVGKRWTAKVKKAASIKTAHEADVVPEPEQVA